MPVTPLRRLAAGAATTALLAGALLIPAALAAADDLSAPAGGIAAEQTMPAPVAASDEAPDASAPAESAPEENPAESAPEESALEEGAPEQGALEQSDPAEGSDETAALGSDETPSDAAQHPTTESTSDAANETPNGAEQLASAAAATPVGHGGVLTVAPGATESLSYTVVGIQSLRFVALGSGFELTLVDPAGQAITRSAAGGYADIFMFTRVDGTAHLSVRNTTSTTQQIVYGFGWVGAHIRSDASSGIGQPELAVSASPNQDGTSVVGSGNVSVVAADGSFQTLPLAAPGYRAQFDGLTPGRYLVRTEMTILGVRSVGTWTTTVAAAETTPPTVDVATAPSAPAAGGWFPGAVDVTISASDAGSGQSRIYWAVDSTTLAEVFGTSVSTRIEAEGTHQLRYQARDQQGNTSALVTRQINIDSTAPDLTLQGFVDGDEFEQDEVVAIEYLCEDALSGIQSCVGDIGSGDFLDTSTPGTHTFRVTATDRAGNERIVERSYTVLEPDTTDPVIEVDVPAVPASGWYLDTVTVRFTASDESGIRRIHYEYGTMQGTVSRDIEADTAEVTFDRTQLYHLSYWAEDAAGNRSEGEQINLYVDSDAPWIDVSNPDEGELSILPNGHVAQNERIEIDFRCDDIGSGIASCNATTPDGELLPTGVPGTHELRIEAVDIAGHRTLRVVTYTVDAAPASGTPGAVGRGGLATTGAQDVAPTLVLAMLLLGAGAALAVGRRLRTR